MNEEEAMKVKVHVGNCAGIELCELDQEALNKLIDNWLPTFHKNPNPSADDKRLAAALEKAKEYAAQVQQKFNQIRKMIETNEQGEREPNMEPIAHSGPKTVYAVQAEEDCPVKFSTEEFIEISQEVADAYSKINRIDSQLKSLRENYKEQISGLKGRLAEAIEELSKGYYLKPVPCTIIMDCPVSGKKTCTRKDTGDQVWEKDMTNEDRQMRLSLQGDPQDIQDTNEESDNSDEEAQDPEECKDFDIVEEDEDESDNFEEVENK